MRGKAPESELLLWLQCGAEGNNNTSGRLCQAPEQVFPECVL